MSEGFETARRANGIRLRQYSLTFGIVMTMLFMATAAFAQIKEGREGGVAAAFESPPKSHREFWRLVGIDAMLRAADVATSEISQHRGGTETYTSWELGRHPGATRMSLTLGAEAVAWHGGAYLLDRQGHHRASRITQLTSIGLEIAGTTITSIGLLRHR